MDSLGNRIRNLRKKRKLTLEAVAGEQMTKGMLSLIENDKAQPSMESLAFIAAKLGIGVNELLEPISTSELRDLLQEAERHFKAKKYETVVEQLSEIMEKKLPSIYEAAKLLDIYGKSSYLTEDRNWLEILQRADELFMSLGLFNSSAELNFFLAETEMKQHHYEKALELLIQKREILREKQAKLDTLIELDFIWSEVGALFAIDQYDKASERLHQAIALSKQKNVYYRIEELYRMAFLNAMMNERESDMAFYLNKLQLFADFIDSQDARINVTALRIEYHNTYTKNYNEALKLVEDFYSSIEEEKLKSQLKYFYVMEKGKALYGKGEYEQALDYLLEFKKVTEWSHPFDLSFMYVVNAYIARCYHMLGDNKKSYENAKYAWDHVKKLPKTPYKSFITETIELVKQKDEQSG